MPNFYPYDHGYCELGDVEQRINSGTYDSSVAERHPSSEQIEKLIAQGAASIDMVLLRRGYAVPLKVQPDYTDPATATNCVSAQVYTLLQQINADMVTGKVEATRHASDAENMDKNSSFWLRYADDCLVRLERDADNLKLLGLDGPFKPNANPSQAMAVGGAIDSSGSPTTPLFSVGQEF